MPEAIATDAMDLVLTVDLVGRATVYSHVSQAAAVRALRGMAELLDLSAQADEPADLRIELLAVVRELADLLSVAGPHGAVPAGPLLRVTRELRDVIDESL